MAQVECKGCGSITNTTCCNWQTYSDKKPRLCYVRWINGIPEKGCGYDKLIENSYKEWVDSILKGQDK